MSVSDADAQACAEWLAALEPFRAQAQELLDSIGDLGDEIQIIANNPSEADELRIAQRLDRLFGILKSMDGAHHELVMTMFDIVNKYK